MITLDQFNLLLLYYKIKLFQNNVINNLQFTIFNFQTNLNVPMHQFFKNFKVKSLVRQLADCLEIKN
ncbi:MAG: hypothetical protein UR99_C0006G0032 [Candidatus Moranbacteria bacterium GW2011_GWD2_36_12]|nr:MAG: hypothetical protein UR99_C0006G0032 [Candidatus Moranbacteria bacterium GW2011_GWD2_36_12]KKQ07158.1 MAG: hypothetical protein US16_C0002G0032 [Candidatus Moranbacteria bacterium GW2011_GWE2_36_40]